MSAPQPAAVATPPRWTTTVFAKVPAPGYPAYVHVHTNGRVYAGTYAAVEAGTPSRVLEWSRTGTLLRSWEVPGQPSAEHGVQVANQTRSGRLVVLDTSTSTVRTLNTRTGAWRTVAHLPGAVPNYATWGPGGLYVTDYAQSVIWRVAPDGRVSRWFSSPALAGVIERGEELVGLEREPAADKEAYGAFAAFFVARAEEAGALADGGEELSLAVAAGGGGEHLRKDVDLPLLHLAGAGVAEGEDFLGEEALHPRVGGAEDVGVDGGGVGGGALGEDGVEGVA